MDTYQEVGIWLMTEARLSFKYWHSSGTLRKNMKRPFFDRTQCEWILKQYDAVEEERLA